MGRGIIEGDEGVEAVRRERHLWKDRARGEGQGGNLDRGDIHRAPRLVEALRVDLGGPGAARGAPREHVAAPVPDRGAHRARRRPGRLGHDLDRGRAIGARPIEEPSAGRRRGARRHEHLAAAASGEPREPARERDRRVDDGAVLPHADDARARLRSGRILQATA